eukprot:TRINITY_DN4674_c0_g1_i3.p1 TRINITY_DN4674_c0_g1~~TRINITY_DN4674_c0_g1_i3.p1  ORF type:complete len:143 (+),score=38.05 TRINITY_DN4674_c0_g1_i3:33-461(+)
MNKTRPKYHNMLTSVRKSIKKINEQKVLFFTKTDDLSVLNKAILYVRENELTDSMYIAHVYKEESKIPSMLREHVRMLDHCYPKIRIDLVLVQGKFNPDTVQAISKQLSIDTNFMFISCPDSQSFKHDFSALGGVRVIMGAY